MPYEPLKLFIPEIALENGLKAVFRTVREDFEAASDETETILYRTLSGLQFGNYNFFEEAKKVIIDNEPDNPRRLEIRSFFDPTRANLPTIHITLPGEDSNEATNGIGVDRGAFEVEYNDPTVPNSYIQYLGRRFRAVYNIVVTSDNPNEVVLLYSFLKGATIAFFDHWSMLGFENLSIGGGDIEDIPNLPARCYMRAFTLSFEYQVQVLEYFSNQIIKNFNLIQVVSVE